jgi:hypothetical protein
MSYDAGKTVTGTGTSMTISATPAYTVVAGDLLIVGSEVRKITVVTTQTSYTIESAFTADPSAAACCISQAVHSKDIYNSALDGSAISDAFGATTFSEIAVDYEDTTTVNDAIFDVNVAPVVAYSASHNGTSWTSLQNRPTLETDQIGSTVLNASGTALYLRFFAKKTSGSGSVNVLRYKAYMQKTSASTVGSIQNSAYAFTNGVGTPVNCSLSVLGGKTTVTLGFTYAVAVSSGKPQGGIEVYLNGQLLPRYIDATLTPDGSYTETSANVITLDSDYSAQNLSLEVIQRVQVIDSSTQNTTNISYLQTVPTIQKFLSGSGTYTTPTSPRVPRYLKVRMVGGGGGGGGSNSSAGAGGNGNNTTFGSSLLIAGGGFGGAGNVATGGLGGTNTVNSPALLLSDNPGQTGMGFQAGSSTAGVYIIGANGGASAMGAGACASGANTAGTSAAANTGGGGQSGGTATGAPSYSGAGGGAGGYLEAIITSPSSTYAYSVGSGGSGGTAGASGWAGGAGGSGIIIVEEYY